jgi:5-methyltetrahydropteroyltriglutamate--homocysteine methyltransferase
VLPPIDAGVYPDREQLYADLGDAYRAAVRAFAAAGCRYLHSTVLAVATEVSRPMVARRRPDRCWSLRAADHAAIADAPVDMTVTLHSARQLQIDAHGGGYEIVEDVLFNELDVDGYFMEYDDERSGGFEPLRLLPKGKRVALGLVTTKRGKLETNDDLKGRIDAAAKFADLDQLCLAPQCGFSSTEEGNLLTEDEQWANSR